MYTYGELLAFYIVIIGVFTIYFGLFKPPKH